MRKPKKTLHNSPGKRRCTPTDGLPELDPVMVLQTLQECSTPTDGLPELDPVMALQTLQECSTPTDGLPELDPVMVLQTLQEHSPSPKQLHAPNLDIVIQSIEEVRNSIFAYPNCGTEFDQPDTNKLKPKNPKLLPTQILPINNNLQNVQFSKFSALEAVRNLLMQQYRMEEKNTSSSSSEESSPTNSNSDDSELEPNSKQTKKNSTEIFDYIGKKYNNPKYVIDTDNQKRAVKTSENAIDEEYIDPLNLACEYAERNILPETLEEMGVTEGKIALPTHIFTC